MSYKTIEVNPDNAYIAFYKSEPITALIRTHAGRKLATNNAIKSGLADAINFHVIEDPYTNRPANDYSYNLLCNDLKATVREGYFFFLDSDDTLIPGALEKIRPFLRPDRALIVQMLRNGVPKPSLPQIVAGRIGLPCLILHSKHRHIADIGSGEYGDFEWIKAVTDQMPWVFCKTPLVDAGKRNYGK